MCSVCVSLESVRKSFATRKECEKCSPLCSDSRADFPPLSSYIVKCCEDCCAQQIHFQNFSARSSRKTQTYLAIMAVAAAVRGNNIQFIGLLPANEPVRRCSVVKAFLQVRVSRLLLLYLKFSIRAAMNDGAIEGIILIRSNTK